MADNTNPFLEDLVENVENEFVVEDETPISPARHLTPETEDITIDTVASKLLAEHFILTALELHTELTETGRELPRLRDFFSNPANFERTRADGCVGSPGLPRTSSCQTFDSLDFARYSDDGERQTDERVAVLEFELRKAQDTIKSLRTTLTRAAETELSSPERNEGLPENLSPDGEPLRLHEKRALNFLVNEYLLLNDYKLSCVTFAEENENQDFEDWDDVGLNIPKPPDLLHLYRDYNQHVTPSEDVRDGECQVEIVDSELEQKKSELEALTQELETKLAAAEENLSDLSAENETLKQKIKSLESQPSASGVLTSSTPFASPVKHKTDDERGQDNSAAADISGSRKEHDLDQDAVDVTANLTPIEADSMQVEVGSSAETSRMEAPVPRSDEGKEAIKAGNYSWVPVRRNMSNSFQSALLNITFQIDQTNRIVSEVSSITDSSSEKVVNMLGRCLPHIVPNVLLAKREELIPLILATACLHPEPKERDNLLNILFNLIKRPDFEQRQIILTGCVAFAQHVGPRRVEEELLPQCWEQIGHKYSERRLLVSESCGALAPYLPKEIRSSLVLSMLQQMLCDDKTEEVRESVVRSLGLLISFMDDEDKYSKGFELLKKGLEDSSEKVVIATQQVLLPAFACWARDIGRLESDLFAYFIDMFEESLAGAKSAQVVTGSKSIPIDDGKFVMYVRNAQELLPMLFSAVLENDVLLGRLVSDVVAPEIEVSRFPKPSCPLLDLSVIVGDPEKLTKLVFIYESIIAEEWFEMWSPLKWVVDDLVPRFLNLTSKLDVSHAKVVHSLSRFFIIFCRTFGRQFTDTKVKPKFLEVLTVSEEQLDERVASGKTPLTSCAVPVFSSGVLMAFNKEEDRKQLTTFLQDLMCTLSLCHASLDSLKAAFKEICNNPSYHELLLTVLWDGVVHTSAQVRSTTAHLFEMLVKGLSEHLVATRVVPALVTLSSDPEMSVRVATVPTYGTIMECVTQREVLDKVYMQIQTFMDDPLYKDQHDLLVELIRTFARVGPNAEPKFRDEFIIPRLAVLAAINNHVTNETRRSDIMLQLFDAYSALCCCFISDQLIQEAMLPGLSCLQKDMAQIAQDHEDVVSSMIKEFRMKLETSRAQERSSSTTSQSGGQAAPPPPQPSEDVKSKMLNRFKEMRDSSGSSKLSNIFKKK
ncbi:RAB11-binding protein RELCH homolog [Lineus longissimus]|uniref:RAB11-binding protein RELCH homolog n=1 Tax=Lineus longissimus TaxID=88925 RepID=UPI00315DE5F1